LKKKCGSQEDIMTAGCTLVSTAQMGDQVVEKINNSK
jgi:hypothetical protein